MPSYNCPDPDFYYCLKCGHSVFSQSNLKILLCSTFFLILSLFLFIFVPVFPFFTLQVKMPTIFSIYLYDQNVPKLMNASLPRNWHNTIITKYNKPSKYI